MYPRTIVFICCFSAIVFTGCSDSDKASPVTEKALPDAKAPVNPSPTSPGTTESKEAKNARMEAMYAQAEQQAQASDEAIRKERAAKALSELNFRWTAAPSFQKAGGKAFLDLDARNVVPTSGMGADRYKTPAFSRDGRVVVEKSATLERIEQAFAESDWLTLINLGGGTKYTSLPSVSRIDSAVKNLGLGVGLRVGRDPYQLHIYHPGAKGDLTYLAINPDRRSRCRLIQYGKGTIRGRLIPLPESNEYVLRFYATDRMPTLVSGPVNLKAGPLHQLNEAHVDACAEIKRRMTAGEIDKAEGAGLIAAAEEKLARAFQAWAANH